ncbi:hypothetical protein SBOR_7777 [Sclerotinia borealis F-4128]|uniref:Uncharacterized protein n=1 Tax=Sclerotinia borealis (strain F-4128) TaxID=1432307 RepID=W9CBC8_SCLBF|nr:hypothetical protein SBOR_7777 [Sclerotinia borealis F-4128]
MPTHDKTDRNRETKLVGVARIDICSLTFEEGCRRYDAANYVPVLVSKAQLANLLRASNVTRNDLKTTSVDGSLPLVSSNQNLLCPHGQHRIKAAKEFLSKVDRWWTIEIYLIPSNRRTREEILAHFRHQFSHETGFSDGDVYCNVRLYQAMDSKFEAESWMAKLTNCKRINSSQLLKHEDMTDLFDQLLPVPGLWAGLELGNIQKHLALRCDEEMTRYLKHIWSVWQDVTLKDREIQRATDIQTVRLLQLRVPKLSTCDKNFVKAAMGSGLLFPRITSSKTRVRILQVLLEIDCLIPSIKTMHENLKYLEVGAKILNSLLITKHRRLTLHETLRLSWTTKENSFVELKDKKLYVRVATNEAGWELVYKQIWIWALRNFAELGGRAPRKEQGKPRYISKLDPTLYYEFAQFAAELGIITKKITNRIQCDPNHERVVRTITQIYPSQSKIDIENIANDILNQLPLSENIPAETQEVHLERSQIFDLSRRWVTQDDMPSPEFLFQDFLSSFFGKTCYFGGEGQIADETQIEAEILRSEDSSNSDELATPLLTDDDHGTMNSDASAPTAINFTRNMRVGEGSDTEFDSGDLMNLGNEDDLNGPATDLECSTEPEVIKPSHVHRSKATHRTSPKDTTLAQKTSSTKLDPPFSNRYLRSISSSNADSPCAQPRKLYSTPFHSLDIAWRHLARRNCVDDNPISPTALVGEVRSPISSIISMYGAGTTNHCVDGSPTSPMSLPKGNISRRSSIRSMYSGSATWDYTYDGQVSPISPEANQRSPVLSISSMSLGSRTPVSSFRKESPSRFELSRSPIAPVTSSNPFLDPAQIDTISSVLNVDQMVTRRSPIPSITSTRSLLAFIRQKSITQPLNLDQTDLRRSPVPSIESMSYFMASTQRGSKTNPLDLNQTGVTRSPIPSMASTTTTLSLNETRSTGESQYLAASGQEARSPIPISPTSANPTLILQESITSFPGESRSRRSVIDQVVPQLYSKKRLERNTDESMLHQNGCTADDTGLLNVSTDAPLNLVTIHELNGLRSRDLVISDLEGYMQARTGWVFTITKNIDNISNTSKSCTPVEFLNVIRMQRQQEKKDFYICMKREVIGIYVGKRRRSSKSSQESKTDIKRQRIEEERYGRDREEHRIS